MTAIAQRTSAVFGACFIAILAVIFSTHRVEATDDTGQTRAFRYLMGTSMRVEVYGGSPADRDLAVAEAFAAIGEVDRLMSDYRDDSELTAINRTAASSAVPASPPMFAILTAAEQISQKSHGAFDVSVRPLMQLWGFKTREAHVPTPQELATVRPLIDFRNILLDRNAHTVRFARAGVEIDLGGIAKGFAAELAAASLQRRGLAGMVDAGGNQHMVGRPPGKEGWTVGIRHPDRPEALLGAIDITDGAVSTSADTSNFLTAGSRRYGHILNPLTLQPADASLSATVVSNDGTIADGLSKALFVLGPKEGLALLDQFPQTWGVVAYRTAEGGVGVDVSAGHTRSFHPAAQTPR